MKFTIIIAALFLLAGCIQIGEQIVTRADSQQISEISDGLYCPVASEKAQKDLENDNSVCTAIFWNADQQYYSTGGSTYYAMRIGDGVVLVQKILDESDPSDWIDLAVLRTTDNAYTRIYLESGAQALASKHGILLNEEILQGTVSFQLSHGNKESYLNFFRDIAKGISIDGEAVSSLDSAPEFHESLFGQVLKGGEPHPSVASKVEQLKHFPSRSPSSSPPAPVTASSSVSSSGVETLDEILTVLRTANVRAHPSAQADKVGRLKAGAEVDVTGRTMVEGKQWYRIDLDGHEAYVIGYIMSPSSAPPAVSPSIYSAPAPGTNVAAAVSPGPAKTGLQPGSTFRDCDDCPEMVVIPAGQFRMGDLDGGGDSDELPVHEVNIQKNFAVGKYEVTRDEYAAFVRATGQRTVDGCARIFYKTSKQDAAVNWQSPGFDQTGRDPVACVDWNEATAYADWMSDYTGYEYRLLSESEWEYAARAQTNTKYSFGNEESDFCNFGNGYDISIGENDGKSFECSDGFGYETAPVGSFRANNFGLHDMHGNLKEWVEDCSSDDYEGAPDDGSALTTSECSKRRLRGGSWWGNPKELRPSYREYDAPSAPDHTIGFRVARTLTKKSAAD